MLLLILYLLFYILLLGCRQAVRHQVLVLAFRGSNPCTPAIISVLAYSISVFFWRGVEQSGSSLGS